MVKAQFSNQSNQSSEGGARAIRQAKHSAGQMDSRIIAGLLGNVAAAARGREGGRRRIHTTRSRFKLQQPFWTRLSTLKYDSKAYLDEADVQY